MADRYTLEWIDKLISVTLNVKRTNVQALLDTELHTVQSQLNDELIKIEAGITHQVFACTNTEQVKLLLSQYHHSLVLLHDRATANQHNHQSNLNKQLVASLDGLLQFLETRFHHYLPLDRTVPASHFIATKKELLFNLKKLKQRFADEAGSINVVLDNLTVYVSEKGTYTTTHNKLGYAKALLKQLEQVNIVDHGTDLYNIIDRLLIQLNFNSKEYIYYLCHHITEKLGYGQSVNEKINILLEHQQSFAQSWSNHYIVWDADLPDLKTTLLKWFEHEVYYLETKEQYANGLPAKNNVHANPVELPKQKIRSSLSVDQLALILRSADDLKILVSRSLNAIFKTVVPYLSTPRRENISYDSMRSKSYSAETRDKDIVIGILNQMIDKIEEY